MDVSRIRSGTKQGYSYWISLNAVQESSLGAIEGLSETLHQLSQAAFATASIRFPEYLDADGAERLATLLGKTLTNARVCITVDEQPMPGYELHPDLIPFRNGTSRRDLKEDYLLKQRQITALRAQIAKIHFSIPGFRANEYSSYRSPLSPDLKIGDCTPQDLWVALMLNSGFNAFDPYQVVSDLYAHRDLWIGFAMLPDIEVITSQQYPTLHRRGYVRFLSGLSGSCGVALCANRHQCDCLYVVAANDETVFQLVDFGKAWSADDVQVYTGEDAQRLLDDDYQPAPVLRYWWD